MDAKKGRVLAQNRQPEQAALRVVFTSRVARAAFLETRLAREIPALRAGTEAPTWSGRGQSGQHALEGTMHRGARLPVERLHGAHQRVERIARQRRLALCRQA